MKKVLVTGGGGKIGTILAEELGNQFEFKRLDKNHAKGCAFVEVSCYNELYSAAVGQEAIVHLAWDSQENWRSNVIMPVNKTMAENVYRVAAELKISRVIVASSIHADDWNRPKAQQIMTTVLNPTPTSLYGATKVYIEMLGKFYALHRGLEVICLRFGGVDPQDVIRQESGCRQIFLSRRDCVSLVKKCLEVEVPRGSFHNIYGISDNRGARHNWANQFGWKPQDNGCNF